MGDYLRKRYGSTHAQLARLLKIQKSQVVQFENGKRRLPLKSSDTFSVFGEVYQKKASGEIMPEVFELRRKEVETAIEVLLREQIKFKLRVGKNKQLLAIMKEKYEYNSIALDNLLWTQQHGEALDTFQKEWVEEVINCVLVKLKLFGLTKQSEVEIRIAEAEAGLSKLEEILSMLNSTQNPSET